jgi:hypothetical protein
MVSKIATGWQPKNLGRPDCPFRDSRNFSDFAALSADNFWPQDRK